MNESHESINPETQVNEYLLIREIKMKRNQERLRELGLVKYSPPPLSSTSSSLLSLSSKIAPKRQHEEKMKKTYPTRRSLRLNHESYPSSTSTEASKEIISLTPSSSSSSSSNNNKAKRQQQNTTSDDKLQKKQKKVDTSSSLSKPSSTLQKNINPTITTSTTTTTTAAAPIIKPGTTRSIAMDVQKVLCGPYCNYPVFIGRTLSSTGKAAVLAHANYMCGNDIHISFNKYSGVCEFQNNAIFLWVNDFNTPNSEVRNEFTMVDMDMDMDHGTQTQTLQMTWYGGSKMRMDSPVIQKLMDIGKKASMGDLSESCGIVLWYRLYNVSKRQFEPYSCLGRLGYHHHESESHPVKFIFNLLDYQYLKVATSQPDQTIMWDEILKIKNVS